jgi:alpha-L-rhamnosidase
MPLTATALRCDHLTDPLAVDNPRPQLGWAVESANRGARQSAWRIQAAGSPEALAAERGLLWDSGRVADGETLNQVWGGAELDPCTLVHWRVMAWDAAGVPGPWSTPARFQTGLMRHAGWAAARWIASPAHVSTNCQYFRRDAVFAKPVVAAYLYATAKGVLRAWIDGERASDEELAPGWTDYHQRQHYRCWDVSSLVKGDRVTLCAQLADGWFRGAIGWRQASNCWGDRIELLLLLRVQHVDGTWSELGTDGQWRIRNAPVVESSFLRGEIHDATQEVDGWNLPGHDTSAWWTAVDGGPVADKPALLAHPGPPIRRLAEFRSVRRWLARPGVWIIDLGQNFAGRVRIRVSAPAGTTIRIRHGEMVTPDRQLYVDNLRQASAVDLYTCRGGGVEVWEPAFAQHGFQYVELAGWPGEPADDAVTGIQLGSDTPVLGTFTCSDPLVEQLWRNALATQRANYIDIPTDCPQRDERLGWTGDAQAFVATAAWNCDISAFYRKWLGDLRDGQHGDGCVPNFVPIIVGLNNAWPLQFRGDAAWGDAATICPWALYDVTGDRRFLEDNFSMMVRWVAYLESTALPESDLRRPDWSRFCSFGDWLSVDADTPCEVVMTAFFAHSSRLVADAARLLGHSAEAARFDATHQRVRSTFRRHFLKADGRVQGLNSEPATQTGQLLALRFGLCDDSERAAVTAVLAADIEARGCRLTTGFVGLPYLLPELSRNGRGDLALRLLRRTEYPSWLYPITQGATTIWERWNGWKADEGPSDPCMNSFSHYAYGAVGEWLYCGLCGIQALEPAFARIRIRPVVGGGLSHAAASHRSPRGLVSAAWTLADGRIQLDCTLPANTSGEVWIPTSDPAALREGGAPLAATSPEPGWALVPVGAGTWRFSAPV